MTRRAAVILVVSALVQVALATIPATMSDLLEYRSWARQLTRVGLAGAYWPVQTTAESGPFTLPIDYPPLLPYVLSAIGRLVHAVSPEALEKNDRLLDFLIRLPLVASSLFLALVVYRETRRTVPGAAPLALALVALNPAIVFDTAYWGQADAPCALLVTASFVALVRGRPEWAWAAIATAALVKPLAYPFLPLVLVETLRRFGPRRALRSAGAAGAVAGAALLPFLWSGHLAVALRTLVTQVDAMPYISVNAHNLWWLVGRGVPWTEAHVRPLGLLSWSTLSLLLFGAFYLFVIVLLLRSREPRGLYVAAATVSFGFFVLSTHMHENHLFYALPLLALAGAESRPARTVLAVLTVTTLANMALHDPLLTDWARPYTPGPHVLLPSGLEPTLELQEQFARLGYPWIVRQLRGESTLVGLVATLVNALVVVLTLGAWLVVLRRARGLDQTLHLWACPLPRWFWLVGAALAVSAGAPFVAHVLRFESQHYFLLHFENARTVTDDPTRVGIHTFDIDGDRRKTLFVHPPSEVRYDLVPPPGAILRTAIAQAWSTERGDGVQFEIRVEDEGRWRTLLSRRMDPRHEPADRRWEPVTVDLSPFSGRPITLTFATTAGGAGDIDFDWAGFADPSLETR